MSSRDARNRSTRGRRSGSSPPSAERAAPRASRRRSSGATRSSPRSPARPKTSAREPASRQGAGRRWRRRRQVATAVGVLQAPGRDPGVPLLASGPVPGLRRRGRLLGARRDGARPCRHPRGGGARRGAGEAGRVRREVRRGRARTAADRAPPGPPARARAANRTGTWRTCSAVGGCSSSGSRA